MPVNDARAMRVAEIVSDFRNLQHYMAQIQASPSAEEYYLPGYSLLRACITEAQAVLAAPYTQSSSAGPGGNLEAEKAQLRAYVHTFSLRSWYCTRDSALACTSRRWRTKGLEALSLSGLHPEGPMRSTSRSYHLSLGHSAFKIYTRDT